ncbi:hypothetical protein ABPG77_010347 [Micractinium sp. CCAP 211/92]
MPVGVLKGTKPADGSCPPSGGSSGTKPAGSSRPPSGSSSGEPFYTRIDWALSAWRWYKSVSTVSTAVFLWGMYKLMTIIPLLGHMFWVALAIQVLVPLYAFLRYD